jgi:hypothetical protein
MKHKIFLGTLGLFLIFSACQPNQKPPTDQEDAADATPAITKDSMIGPTGAETARFTAADTFRTFEYAKFSVKVTDVEYGGEIVTVSPNDGSATWKPISIEMGYFGGIVGNYLLIDEGAIDIDHVMHIFDLSTGLEIGTFGFDNNQLSFENNAIVFYQLEQNEKKVLQKPTCPEADDWRKGGLDIGYTQKKSFDLATKKVKDLGVWACMPLS